MNLKTLIILLFLACLNYGDTLSASTVNYNGIDYEVVDNGFSYEYLLGTRDADPISTNPAISNVYRSSKDTGNRDVIRIVNGPLPNQADNRQMLKMALEDGRTVRDGGPSDRIVILHPGLYRISDFLTLRGNTTLVGTIVNGERTTIELTPGANFAQGGPGGLNVQNGNWPVSGVRPVIVVANTRNSYDGTDIDGLTEDQQLQVILSDGKVRGNETYSQVFGFDNDVYHVGLKNINIIIPQFASRAIGVLWRTAQQSFIEDVNVNPTSITSTGDDIGGYAGFMAQGIGGGGHWRNCGITGTRYGVLGFVGQVVVMGLTLNNIGDIPIYWNYAWSSPIFRSIEINNCEHGLVFDACAAVTILDSQINPPNASEFSPIVLLNADWMKNVYLQNVKSSASHLVRKRAALALPNESSLINWEAWHTGDTDHVPNQNGEAKAHHWVSGAAVIDQVPYEEEELPTVHSSDFPGLDAACPAPNGKLIWYSPDSSETDHTGSLQAAIHCASVQSADLIIPPGTYTCYGQIFLESNSRILGIQYPMIKCDPSNFPWNSTYNPLWGKGNCPKAFISTPDGAGNVLLDGLWISTAPPTDAYDDGGAGIILFDWRCPARILNTQINTTRYSKACIRVAGNASGLLLNCMASTNYNGAYTAILGDKCSGPIDFVAVNAEHVRYAGIKLVDCSDFNFLCLQFEQTGKGAWDPRLGEPVWATTPEPAHPRNIDLEGCKEIRFFNAAGSGINIDYPDNPRLTNFPDSAFVINNCDAIFSFEPKCDFPDPGVAAILATQTSVAKGYLHTATIAKSYSDRIEKWIPFADGYFAPSFGIKKRDSLVGRWKFDSDAILKDSVGINDASGSNFMATTDGGIQAVGPPQTTPPSSGGSADIIPKDRMLDQEAFSVSVRVKRESGSGARSILTYDAEGSGRDWAIIMNTAGRIFARSWQPQSPYAPVDTPASDIIVDGDWHEVTLTYDGGSQTASLYVDTVAVGSTDWSHRLQGRPRLEKLSIGYLLENGDYTSVGSFDDLRFWNYVRSPQEISLAGHWTFDPQPGAGIVKDSAGINDVSGTSTGFLPITDGEIQAMGPGTSSSAGASAYIIPKDWMLDQESFSVSVRVKPVSIPTSEARSILTYDAQADGHDWAIVMNPSGQVVGRSWQAQSPYQRQDTPASEDIRDGRWHEITLTYDKDSRMASLYVDTVFIGSTQWNLRLGGRPRLNRLSLGYLIEFQTYISVGLYDDLRFWSYARSAEEIGLAGHWEFDPDPVTGSIVKDSAGINDVSGTNTDFLPITDGEIQAMGPKTPSSDGASAYIIPKDRMLDQKTFSVFVRVKRKPGNGARSILTYDAEGSGRDWAIIMNASGGIFARSWRPQSPYAPVDTPASDIIDGDWHEIILTYDGVSQTANLYVDTVAVGSADWSHRLGGRPKLEKLSIGYLLENGNYTSAGSFDDLRFYNYVLPEIPTEN